MLLLGKSYANEQKCKQWRQQRFAYTEQRKYDEIIDIWGHIYVFVIVFVSLTTLLFVNSFFLWKTWRACVSWRSICQHVASTTENRRESKARGRHGQWRRAQRWRWNNRHKETGQLNCSNEPTEVLTSQQVYFVRAGDRKTVIEDGWHLR